MGMHVTHLTMKITVRLVSVLAVTILVSCSSRPIQSLFGHASDKPDPASAPDKAIFGRWREAGTISIGVFHEDGTVEVTTGKDQVSGKFSFIAPGKLKMEMVGEGGKPLRPRVYDVTLTGDKMIWKDVNGVISEFVRTK